MLALKITNVKDFMNQLLNGNIFDHFYVSEVSITTSCHFHIDGSLQTDFYDSDTAEALKKNQIHYASWREIRPFCFSIIKGKLPPLRFKIILNLSPEQLDSAARMAHSSFYKEHVRELFLNIQYHEKELLCTTGISKDGFSLSREADIEWDQMTAAFMKKNNFTFEE